MNRYLERSNCYLLFHRALIQVQCVQCRSAGSFAFPAVVRCFWWGGKEVWLWMNDVACSRARLSCRIGEIWSIALSYILYHDEILRGAFFFYAFECCLQMRVVCLVSLHLGQVISCRGIICFLVFLFFWFVGFFFNISIFNSCSKHFSYYSFLHHYYLLYFHHCTPKLCNRNNTLNSIGCWLPSRKLMSSVWALLSMYAYFSGHGHCISPFLQTFSLLRQPGGIKSEPVVWRALSPSSADWRGSSASSFTCLAMQLSIAQLSVMNE